VLGWGGFSVSKNSSFSKEKEAKRLHSFDAAPP
jgi:hypothetical protein